MGGPLANIWGLCKGDRIRGRGEVARAVVALGICGATTGCHVKNISVEAGKWRRQESDWCGAGKRGEEESVTVSDG